MLRLVVSELRALADPVRAKTLSRYFKTGKGQYAEGDFFIGVTVPAVRRLARKFSNLPLPVIRELLGSNVHENRLLSLLILVERARKKEDLKPLFEFYLENIHRVNNWDLVDLSAPKIVGSYLCGVSDRSILSRLARSESLWERRIAIIATYAFIVQGDFSETLRVSEMLLDDKHDLIHKAVGWMLREVGKRSLAAELSFIEKWSGKMPRTMLRYAVEKFNPELRIRFSSKK